MDFAMRSVKVTVIEKLTAKVKVILNWMARAKLTH